MALTLVTIALFLIALVLGALYGRGKEPIEDAATDRNRLPPKSKDSELRVEQSDWVFAGGTLMKQYQYTGLLNESSVHILRIEIDTSGLTLGGFSTHVAFLFSPRIWSIDNGYIVAQLSTADGTKETPVTAVRIGSSDDGDICVIQPIDTSGAQAFVGVIAQKKPMILSLIGERQLLARIPIPNDEQYHEVAKEFFAEADKRHHKSESILDTILQLQDSREHR